MRKSFIPFFTLCLCLCLLCGCGAAAQLDEELPAAEDKAGNGLALTQTQAVSTEKYLGQDEFAPFLSRAEKAYLIPGLNEAAIPQGMDYCGENGLIYISAYFKADAVPSVIVALDAQSGSFAAEYRLYNSDGSPFSSHVGGLAAAGDKLYVSAKLDNDGNYSVAVIPLDRLPAEGSHDLVIESTVALPVSPSFLNYSGDILWVGNFYHPSADYGLSRGMDFTTETADGEYGCYILGYDLDLDQPDGSVPVGGSQVPVYILDSLVLREAITAMPMTEGLTTGPDGNVLVLFESGAMAYKDGKFRTDHVWRLKLSQ